MKILPLEAFENRPGDVQEIILQGVKCTLVQGVNENSHKTHIMVFCGYDSGSPGRSCFIESFAATNMNFPGPN